MTIYILEGPNGAGKTTLANDIIKRLTGQSSFDNLISGDIKGTVEAWHYGPLAEDTTALEEYLLPLMNWCKENPNGHKESGPHLVIDRFYYGEDVYGPVYRGQSRLSGWERDAITGYLNHVGAVRIYVTADLEVLWERTEKRGHEQVKFKAELQNIKERYDDLMLDDLDWIVWSPEHSQIAGITA